jgi:hypothetical protein
MPAKRYIVRMSKEERDTLQEIVKKLKGTSEKVRRAQILLKADAGADGPRWPDSQIADAFDCSVRSVELIRERLVTKGFEDTINRKPLLEAPRKKLLSGEQEALVIATRLGEPPTGYGQWTLRLLADKVVELGIAESISYETVRRTLKKMA